MKKYKKIIISLGVISVGITPIITTISCSDNKVPPSPPQKTDREKMDGITSIMVKNILAITADPNQFADSVKNPQEKTVTINGLKNVKITISNWKEYDFTGIIKFTASVRKNDLVPPKSPFNIKISGFKMMTIKYVLEQLKKVTKGKIELATTQLSTPYDASNVNNAQWISRHIESLSSIYDSIIHDLSYTGPLKVGNNNIEVFYKGVDQNFTIPVEVNQP